MVLLYQSIVSYQPSNTKPPVLDSSEDVVPDKDSQNIYGLRPFLEAVKRDIDVVKQFLADPDAAFLPPPSTNAPYLIAVWKEVLSSSPPVIAIGKTFHERLQITTDGEGKKHARSQSSGKSSRSGVKVDVVADNGHTWIRVNTAKNSRLLAEFREIDSYLTDSDPEGDGDNASSSLAQIEFDNSLLRTGRALVAAARDNPVLGTTNPPEVVFRLTRIDPDATDGNGNDPRIALTVNSLRNMGLSIKLGERGAIEQLVKSFPALSSPRTLTPTHRINLDLSILIALVSDLTHAPLPESVDAAHERFVPSTAYLEWKRSRLRAKSGGISGNTSAAREDAEDPLESTQHSRALAGQLQQEMRKGMFQEIRERLLACRPGQSGADASTDVSAPPPEGAPPLAEFWTTAEARDRCLRIVAKIGGPAERRRAHALFPTSSSADGVEPPPSPAEQEAQYWAGSRYPRGFLPLPPIRVFSAREAAQPPDSPPRAGFFSALEATCRALLASDDGPSHPRAAEGSGSGSEISRASVVRSNVRLTTHTAQSMLCGAARGWTTLTANRASVKAMLREVRTRGYGLDPRHRGDGPVGHVALWMVDPRSLAEGLRSDAVGASPLTPV
ncbi:hypothetical protein F5148DRAFT_1273074 [Russula earlei]|uniref:Uncharacterized protein n=1 Tax=Russula earlei TaxID=71964 RepID=A0ACC0UP96_9AGAM|nr:hypothetical protein F5148DRAFT_1273074 [Russula earlei]